MVTLYLGEWRVFVGVGLMMGNWFGLGVRQLVQGKRPLQFVLVFALVVGLVMGSAVPNGAQSPAPNSREAVEQQVKKYAERHIESDQSMQTGNVIKVFEKNPANLTSVEIATIYEEEYTKLKKAKDEDFWEQVKPKAGWIVAAMIFVFALFQGKLKTWVEQGISKLEAAIYQKFSGSKLFWNIALEKYRKALVAKHGALKIPFRPNRPLLMDEVYVPLKVAGSRSDTDKIEALQAVRNYRRLMVKGQPGSGKTMLLRYLALNYGSGKLRLGDEPIVILLELHRLSGGAEILPELVEALKRDDFPNGTAFLQQALEKGRVVLLLDGLDEVNSIDRSTVVKRIKDFLDLYEKCGVVITCRSQVYQGEFDGVVNQTLEVVEFTDAQIQQFLRPWKAEMPAEKSVEQLVQALNDRPKIKELARNPFLLTVIAYLYADTTFILPHSRAEFYRESTRWLLELWDNSKQTTTQYKGFIKGALLEHLALFAQDSLGNQGQDRKSLSFKEVITQVKACLPELNLDAEKDMQPIVNEIVERSGLLLRIDGGAWYQFSHLTLQEYFTAIALLEKPQELIEQFEADPYAWREVVKLWCGLAQDSTEVIQRVHEIQPLTGFECLADAKRLDEDLANKIITGFKGELGQVRTTYAIEQAFGAVAVDMRPLGQAVFQFLTNILMQPMSNAHKVQAIRALSFTNSPQAAAILGSHYCNVGDIRQAIVRMGDLAIPHLVEAVGDYKEIAIDDLMSLGTPNAAKALVSYLWHSDIEIAGRAAWHIASLLQQPEIEEELQFIKLENYQSQAKWQEIWVPFFNGKNSALLKISAQTAYLLEVSMPDIIPILQPQLDPRLVIPLCALSRHKIQPQKDLWNQNLDVLLLNATLGVNSQVEEQILKNVRSLIDRLDVHAHWKTLLLTLPPVMQLILLKKLIKDGSSATIQDWKNIFNQARFNFSQSWQYFCIIVIALLLSVLAIVQSAYLPFKAQEEWSSWLLGLPTLVIAYAWIFIWQGVEETLEPNLFITFGVFGWLTFWKQIKLLIQNKMMWVGSEKMYDIVGNDKILTVAVAVATIFATIFIIVGNFIAAGTIFFAFFSTFILALIFKNNSTFTSAFIGAFAFTFAILKSSSTKLGVDANAVFSTIGISIAGIAVSVGISCWYESKYDHSNLTRYGAILSYPFFCAWPFILLYSSLFLHNFFFWPTVAFIWLTIITLCTILWQWGQALECKARNPLQGILPEH